MVRSNRGSGKRSDVKSPAFENVKNQLAYCGLWCGSCLVGNGKLNELAVACRKGITDYGVDHWGPKDIDYDGLLNGLAAIGSMKPCKGCLKGGGRTDCEIRACARGRKVVECVSCTTKRTCSNSKLIGHMRSGALRVGMNVKDKPGDRSKTLRKWMEDRPSSER